MRLRAAFFLATTAAAAADTLAIVTEFRSGSTLLGGLVANASTFYFFEPCRLLGGDHLCENQPVRRVHPTILH